MFFFPLRDFLYLSDECHMRKLLTHQSIISFPCNICHIASIVVYPALRASSYEPGNRAGSFIGTNFVTVHMANISLVDQNEIQEPNPNGAT